MPQLKTIHLVECPRDAMQGWKDFIPTDKKVDYLNGLLRIGFQTLDCGSFVSPQAIPQMADTKSVLARLQPGHSSTRLLTIVANTRGAREAVFFDQVSYLGFPFSISPTFQLRNTNGNIDEGIKRVEEIHTLCKKHNKELVVYLSMAFGNPYGDVYSEDILLEWADRIIKMGITIVSLADTVGKAEPRQISSALNTLIDKYPETEIGVHLHSTSLNRRPKLEAAIRAGCTRFDGALKGIGGCPMADSKLVGNMATEFIISCLEQSGIDLSLNKEALAASLVDAAEVFHIA